MPRLIVTEGRDEGRVLKLEPGKTYRLGRRSDNDFPLKDSTLSRYHCEVRCENEGVHIRDKGSSHGTLINGEARDEAVLHDGDTILVGQTELRFEATPEELAVDEEQDMETEAGIDTAPPGKLALRNDIFSPPPAKQAPNENRKQEESADAAQGFSYLELARHGKRTWLTVAAISGVGILIGGLAFFLYAKYSQPPEPLLVPITQLKDVAVKITKSRLLVDSPPTYIIDIEVENKSEKATKVRPRDFVAVDSAGLSYTPLKPLGKTDFRTTTLAPGTSAAGSLSFELNKGSTLSRLNFQNRGFIEMDFD